MDFGGISISGGVDIIYLGWCLGGRAVIVNRWMESLCWSGVIDVTDVMALCLCDLILYLEPLCWWLIGLMALLIY